MFQSKVTICFIIFCYIPTQTISQETGQEDLIDDIFGKNVDENQETVTEEIQLDLSPKNQTSNTTSSTEDCECVAYYLCNDDKINMNGQGLLDIRRAECDHYLDICCGAGNKTNLPKPTPPPKPSGCGYRNPNGIGFKIQNAIDSEAEFGEFPWMVAIFYNDVFVGEPRTATVEYQCGGALIHPQVVVTAAHCVVNKKRKLTVRAGEWDTQTEKEEYPYQDRDVASMTIHPQYYSGALHNDIALLFLTDPVVLAPNINVVCLPSQNTIVDNAKCFSSGWGRDVFGKEGKSQVILKKVALPIVPRTRCEENLRKTRLGKYFQLHQSFVCAGGEKGKDTCKGDGGSPLICPIEGQEDRYFQYGIVSWGIGCGEENVPGVYVNVPKFRKWIDDQLKFKNFQIDSYQF